MNERFNTSPGRLHLGLTLLLAVGALLLVLRALTPRDEAPSVPMERSAVPPSPNEAEFSTRHVVFLSSDFEQYVDYDFGGKVLRVDEDERNPGTGAWTSSSEQYSTSFQINFVAARTPDELYVFGTRRNGDDIVERWLLESADGSWIATRPLAGSPIGVPLPNPGVLSVSLRGGDWVEPGERFPLAEVREEIYVGTDFGGVLYATVDPEGRFLLVITPQSDKLFQLPIPQAGESVVPALVYDDIILPDLAYMGCIEPREEQSSGRMYVMTTANNELEPTIDRRLILFDPDNDGVFDSLLPVTHDQFKGLGLVWTDTFLRPPGQ